VSRLATRLDVAVLTERRDPELCALLERQEGLISRQQLRGMGWSSGRITRAVRDWQTLLPGVYLTDDRDRSYAVLARAAVLARPDACLSHLTAARLRDWEVLDTAPHWSGLAFRGADPRSPAVPLPGQSRGTRAEILRALEVTWPDPEQIHLTFPRDAKRSWPGQILHRDPQVSPVLVRGLRMTDPVRTLVDVARSAPLPVAVCLLDARFHQTPGLRDEVNSLLAKMVGTRGIVAAHRSVRLADERSESVLESLLRLLIVMSGLPTPTTQLSIRLGTQTYRADLGYQHARLILEADGREYHSEWQDVGRDLVRQNTLVAAGWRVLRFTWAQVLFQPDLVLHGIRTALGQDDQ
jgi:very-short-patch-repair endonuclease